MPFQDAKEGLRQLGYRVVAEARIKPLSIHNKALQVIIPEETKVPDVSV